jgi:ABC-type tungstate transport system substrate-binding protein
VLEREALRCVSDLRQKGNDQAADDLLLELELNDGGSEALERVVREARSNVHRTGLMGHGRAVASAAGVSMVVGSWYGGGEVEPHDPT